MRRVAAVLGAVAMVVAAVVVRGLLDDSDGSGNGTEASGIVLVCAEELAAVCRAAGESDALAERAGDTADRLIAVTDPGTLDVDAWAVPAAWVRVVDDERARLGRDPLFEPEPTRLGSTALLAPIWTDRFDQLESICGTVDWPCLADQAGTSLAGGDRVRIASPDVDTAYGLVVAAWQAAGLLGSSDYAANDFDSTFRARAAALAANQYPDPLTRMRTRGPGEVTATGVPAVVARVLTSTFGSIVAAEPGPDVRLDVVVVLREGSSLTGTRRDALANALVAAGFDPVPDEPDGLPPGGVLAAVRSVWNENR